MVGKTQDRTALEDERFRKLKAMRCAACFAPNNQFLPTNMGVVEIHHQLSGSTRLGHMYTVPLCTWHHRGEPSNGLSATTMSAVHGPSLARSSRLFRQHFGTDAQMLARVNARLEGET